MTKTTAFSALSLVETVRLALVQNGYVAESAVEVANAFTDPQSMERSVKPLSQYPADFQDSLLTALIELNDPEVSFAVLKVLSVVQLPEEDEKLRGNPSAKAEFLWKIQESGNEAVNFGVVVLLTEKPTTPQSDVYETINTYVRTAGENNLEELYQALLERNIPLTAKELASLLAHALESDHASIQLLAVQTILLSSKKFSAEQLDILNKVAKKRCAQGDRSPSPYLERLGQIAANPQMHTNAPSA